MVNVIVDYMLKSNDERIVINDYIENDPLSENNLDKTLYLVNEFRLSSPEKSIWIYSGYTWEEIRKGNMEDGLKYGEWTKRAKIITECDVLVDGRYIDSKCDISPAYRGSSNQRLIDIKQSLQKGEIGLWQT